MVVGINNQNVGVGHGISWLVEPLDVKWAEAIAGLEKEIFSSPWSAAAYQRFLIQPGAWAFGVNGPGLLGYIVGSLGGDEAEIINVAVAVSWRGCGLGFALVLEALQYLQARGVRQVTLEVRRSNTAARRLYHRCGFVERGVRRGYYTNPPEDALVLGWETRCHDGENG